MLTERNCALELCPSATTILGPREKCWTRGDKPRLLFDSPKCWRGRWVERVVSLVFEGSFYPSAKLKKAVVYMSTQCCTSDAGTAANVVAPAAPLRKDSYALLHHIPIFRTHHFSVPILLVRTTPRGPSAYFGGPCPSWRRTTWVLIYKPVPFWSLSPTSSTRRLVLASPGHLTLFRSVCAAGFWRLPSKVSYDAVSRVLSLSWSLSREASCGQQTCCELSKAFCQSM